MSAPILATKLLFPPPRPNLISRPRLVQRLTTGLAGPLTLVSAPPGCGKTTLLAEWRATVGREAAAAWLSLDASDNDPASFLAGLVAALGSAQSGLGQNAGAFLSVGQPMPPEAILAALVNDLSAAAGTLPGGVALVLDDYHVITTPAIHDALAFLLAHLPRHAHLVILTREDPPLPLSKLRVRGELTELRETDLQFTEVEVAAFLDRTMGVQLPPAEVASLTARTEGWVAALQIAGLSLQNRSEAKAFIASFRGDDRYVMDYLMDEVFSRQPPEIQAFLLQTSILERLCAGLCDAVLRGGGEEQSGGPYLLSAPPPRGATAQEILERLESANLFVVSLDNRRHWYPYHHLFADLLRYRLQRVWPERLPKLQRRAAHWYAQAGDPDDAMRHALAPPDVGLAADLAERFLLHMTGTSRVMTYLDWLRQIPDEVMRERAYLCVGAGWAYVLTNQAEAAEQYARAGEAALPAYQPVMSMPEGRSIGREEVAGNLAAIRSYAGRLAGDVPAAVAQAEEALAILPPEALAVRCAAALNLGFLRLDAGEIEPARAAFVAAFEAGRRSRTNVYVALTALSQLGGIAAMRGKLREAEQLFRRALRFGPEEVGLAGPIPGAAIAHGWLMWVYCQRNELDASQAHLDQLLGALTQIGVPETTLRAYLYQGRVETYRGRRGQAEACFARAEALLQTRPVQGVLAAEWIAFRGQCFLEQGDLGAAARMLEAQGLEPSDLDGVLSASPDTLRPLAPRLPAYVFLGRVLAAQGAGQRADALLERVCLLAEAVPNVEVLLGALALRAAIASALYNNPDRGLPHLERALNLAAPEDFARPFLDAGSPLAKPLRQAIMTGVQAAFAQRLLAGLMEEERRRAAGNQTPQILQAFGGLNEPLTDRERQVLRLLAAGLTSNQVAEELVISVSTARSYIKSLYGKLDAHSREEAIERGRERGVL